MAEQRVGGYKAVDERANTNAELPSPIGDSWSGYFARDNDRGILAKGSQSGFSRSRLAGMRDRLGRPLVLGARHVARVCCARGRQRIHGGRALGFRRDGPGIDRALPSGGMRLAILRKI